MQQEFVWVVGWFAIPDHQPDFGEEHPLYWLDAMLAWFDNRTAAEAFLAGYRAALGPASENAYVAVEAVEWSFFLEWMKMNHGVTVVRENAYMH